MKELREFKDALLVRRVVARVANEEHLSKTFPTQEALNEYLKNHPNADKSKHRVEDADTTKLKKDLKQFQKDEKARGDAKDRKDKKEDDAHADQLKKNLEEHRKNFPDGAVRSKPKAPDAWKDETDAERDERLKKKPLEVADKHLSHGLSTVAKSRKALGTLDNLKLSPVAKGLDTEEIGMAGGGKTIRQKGKDHESVHIVGKEIDQIGDAVRSLDNKKYQVWDNLNKGGVKLPPELLSKMSDLRKNMPKLDAKTGYHNRNPHADREDLRKVEYVTEESLKDYKKAVQKYFDDTETFFSDVDKFLKAK